MGMYDTIFAKVNDNVLAMQTKKTECFLDNTYWLGRVNTDELSKNVTSLVDNWYLSDSFNDALEIHFVIIYVHGILVDYSVVKNKTEIEPAREKMLTLWKNPELQNIVISNALKIEQIKSKATQFSFEELSKRFADYAYVEGNMPEIIKYFEESKKDGTNKIAFHNYFKILSNTLIDIDSQAIKDFLKETGNFFAQKGKELESKNKEIEDSLSSIPMAIEDYYMYSQYDTFQAVQYSPEQIFQIYAQINTLLEEVKVWSSKEVVKTPGIISNFLCSYLIKETAGPLLNKKFMSLDTITLDYLKLYDSYPQFLIDTGATLSTIANQCHKKQFNDLIVKNAFVFFTNPLWVDKIINPDILGQKKYFDSIIDSITQNISSIGFNKEPHLNSTILDTMVKIVQEPIIQGFEVNDLNAHGHLLDLLLKLELTEKHFQANQHLKEALLKVEEHIIKSSVYSSNPKRQQSLIDNFKSSPLFANLYSVYEKQIFNKNLEIADGTKKVQNKVKKI